VTGAPLAVPLDPLLACHQAPTKPPPIAATAPIAVWTTGPQSVGTL
jgi:hypothetical protein